jgi:hypothetical protein
VFLPIGRDAQCHDEAVIAEMHGVDQQRDEVESL